MKRRNRGWRRPAVVMLIISLLILTGCASAPKTVYVNDSSRPVQLRAGETAPTDGWLLSPGALVDLMDCCGRALDGRAL